MDRGDLWAQGLCADRAVKIAASVKTDWNGWSPSSTNDRFQNVAGLIVDQVQKLNGFWAQPAPPSNNPAIHRFFGTCFLRLNPNVGGFGRQPGTNSE
jgi:hypothetical protein